MWTPCPPGFKCQLEEGPDRVAEALFLEEAKMTGWSPNVTTDSCSVSS
jgi:hypothetical protein